jgi:Zn ribbon nucleic-acid-binding protein
MSVLTEWDMICPKCNRDDQLQVTVQMWALLTPDGTEPEGDQEWDSESACMCQNCGYAGQVSDFKVE